MEQPPLHGQHQILCTDCGSPCSSGNHRMQDEPVRCCACFRVWRNKAGLLKGMYGCILDENDDL